MTPILTEAREPVSLFTPPLTDRFIELSGTRIRFIEAGLEHAGPPLLMLHGHRDAANHWFPNPLPALAGEHHVIAPDLPQYPLRVRFAARTAARREGLHILQKEHVGNYLKSLTMPTLIVWGSRDRVVPLEHGALMARHIPHARLAVIRAAGHAPFYQKPDEFNRLVLTFLR